MNEASALSFLGKLERLCEDHGAYCDIFLKKNPKLSHIKTEINIKIDTEAQKGVDRLIKNGIIKT